MHSYTVNRDKWAQLSIFAQMGNVYAEVGRSFAAKRRGQQQAADQAAIRALDLFDATVEHLTQLQSPKLKEVLRVRELFALDFFSDASESTLESYLSPFAIAARTTPQFNKV